MLCSYSRGSKIKSDKTAHNLPVPPPLSNRVQQQSDEMWPKKLRGFAATRNASSASYRDEPSAAELCDGYEN
jgi:hypothetical protein